MQNKLNSIFKTTSGKIFIFLMAVAVTLTLLHLFMQHLNLNVYDGTNLPIYEISNRLDLDDEVSVGSWFAQFLFVALSGICFFAAYLQKDKSSKALWFLIASGALIISIDEGSGLHELTLQAIHINLFSYEAPTVLQNAWWVVLPFVLIIGLWLLRKIYKLIDNKTLVLVAIAMAIFVSGAVFVDQATSVANTIESGFFEQGISVAIEEFLEMSAAIIAIYAFANYIERNYKSSISESIKTLKG